MAKKELITAEIKSTATRFANILRKQGIPISKLIIFGSHAKGKAKKNSDIDICIVSSKFGKDLINDKHLLFSAWVILPI